jgi:cytochrome c
MRKAYLERRSYLVFTVVVMLVAFLVRLRGQTANPQASPTPPPGNHSVWDGVYTEKQAERGEAFFHHTCSSCHGDKLTGKESESAPALTGKGFMDEWDGRTVGDLFKKILRKMPQDDPGTLTPQQSADLVAFLLSFNKFPAGKTELPPENEPLAAIWFEAKKPEQKNGFSRVR